MTSKPAKIVPFSPMRGEGITFRNSLDSPYHLKWPEVSVKATTAILAELKSALSDIMPLSKQTKSSCGSKISSNEVTVEQTSPVERENLFNRAKRLQLVVGTNAVNRALEKNALRAGLVCPSVRPPILHHHLLMMSSSRGIPFASIPGLSEAAAPLLGMKKAAAIGFKKLSSIEDHFKSLVSIVSAQAPPILIPWLNVQEGVATRLQRNTRLIELSVAEERVKGGIDKDQTSPANVDSNVTPHIRRKRKAEPIAMATPTSAYRPLKIKRLIVKSKKSKRKK